MTLIITHDEKFAQHIGQVLTTKGQAVRFAFSGHEGLNQAQELSPELIVLDMYLRDPAGYEVLHALRKQGFGGKIILLAGLSVSPLVPDALRFGIERVLSEPLSIGPLECAIRSALGSSEALRFPFRTMENGEKCPQLDSHLRRRE